MINDDDFSDVIPKKFISSKRCVARHGRHKLKTPLASVVSERPDVSNFKWNAICGYAAITMPQRINYAIMGFTGINETADRGNEHRTDFGEIAPGNSRKTNLLIINKEL